MKPTTYVKKNIQQENALLTVNTNQFTIPDPASSFIVNATKTTISGPADQVKSLLAIREQVEKEQTEHQALINKLIAEKDPKNSKALLIQLKNSKQKDSKQKFIESTSYSTTNTATEIESSIKVHTTKPQVDLKMVAKPHLPERRVTVNGVSMPERLLEYFGVDQNLDKKLTLRIDPNLKLLIDTREEMKNDQDIQPFLNEQVQSFIQEADNYTQSYLFWFEKKYAAKEITASEFGDEDLFIKEVNYSSSDLPKNTFRS